MDLENASARISGAAAAFLRDGYWVADGPPDRNLIAQLLAAAEQVAHGADADGEAEALPGQRQRPGPASVVNRALP